MGSVMESPIMPLALGGMAMAAPLMFPSIMGASAAAGGGLAGTGLAAGAATPLLGVGPGGLGAASIGGAIPGMGVGAGMTMPSIGFGGIGSALGDMSGGMGMDNSMMRMGMNMMGNQGQGQASQGLMTPFPMMPPTPQGPRGGGATQAMSNPRQYYTPSPTTSPGGYSYV